MGTIFFIGVFLKVWFIDLLFKASRVGAEPHNSVASGSPEDCQ